MAKLNFKDSIRKVFYGDSILSSEPEKREDISFSNECLQTNENICNISEDSAREQLGAELYPELPNKSDQADTVVKSLECLQSENYSDFSQTDLTANKCEKAKKVPLWNSAFKDILAEEQIGSKNGQSSSMKDCCDSPETFVEKSEATRIPDVSKRKSSYVKKKIHKTRSHSPEYLTEKEHAEIQRFEQIIKSAQCFSLPKLNLSLNEFDGAGVNCFKKDIEDQMPIAVPKPPPKERYSLTSSHRVYVFHPDKKEADRKPLKGWIAVKPETRKNILAEKKRIDFLQPKEYWDDDLIQDLELGRSFAERCALEEAKTKR